MNFFKKIGFTLGVLKCRSNCEKYWVKQNKNNAGVDYFCKKCEEPIWLNHIK